MPKRLSVIVLACYATVCSSALSCTRLLFVFVFGLSISACLRGSRGTGSPTFADPTRQEVARHGHRHGRAQARHRHRHGRAQAPSLPLPPGPKALRCCLLLSFALMVLEWLRDCVSLLLSAARALRWCCCPWSLFLGLCLLPVLARAGDARARACCGARMATRLSAVVAPCCSCLPLLLQLVLSVAPSVAGARGRFWCCCSCTSLLALVEDMPKEECCQRYQHNSGKKKA